MESYFDIMAKHPACLLAVDATDGGKWKSNFKTGYVMPTAPTGSGSFEETHGLLTKTNVEAENNYFKYITDAIGYIETPLDLRGYSGDFTFVAKAMVTKNEITGSLRKDAFILQGNIYFTANSVFAFQLLQKPSDNRWQLSLYVAQSAGSVLQMFGDLPVDFDWTKAHVFAVTYIAIEKKFELLVDDEVVYSGVQATFDSFYNSTAVKTQISCKADGIAPDVMKQYNAMIFDKALSADEIKILSDSMTDKKVEHDKPDTGLLCTTPVNLTSNTSDPDWECYCTSETTQTNKNEDFLYMAAAGYTSFTVNTAGGRWAVDKGGAATGTSAGVRFIWIRKDGAEWAVKRVILGNHWKSVFPQRIHHFILQGSNDGTTWTNIGEKQTPTIAANVYGEQTFDYLSNTEKYKYWAINCNYDLTWTDVAYAQFSAAANKIQFTNEI